MKDVHLRFADDDAKVIDDVIQLTGVSVSAFSRIAILSFARLMLKRAGTSPDIWADTIGKESERGFIEITDSPVVIAAALKKYKATVQVQTPARSVSKSAPYVGVSDEGWQKYFRSVEDIPLSDSDIVQLEDWGYTIETADDYREQVARNSAQLINSKKNA